VAYLEDPSREVVFYAIREGIVKSDEVTPTLVPLGIAAVIQSAGTKQYDFIEATPLAVPRGAQRGFKFVIAAVGLENKDGTLIFVPADSPIKNPKDLKGKTIAVGSLGGTFTLETRFTLKKKYGLNTDMAGGDVKIVEIPMPTIPQVLVQKQVDAGVLLHAPLYKAKGLKEIRILYHATRDYREITGVNSINSVFATYPDRVPTKGKAISAFVKMMGQSLRYYESNKRAVLEAVAAKHKSDPAYLQEWWERYNFGVPLDATRIKAIRQGWEAAREVGDITEVPNVEEFLLK
jgi:NitT/TauT family transport system substrate-binding protein